MRTEACVENFTHVQEMIERGADRIELNDNLAEWGTTPSYGVLKKATELCKRFDIPIIAMIRPRGGDFHYTAAEKEIMKKDIEIAAKLGVNGIAIGALTENKEIDQPFIEEVIQIARELNLEITFHRAFDEIPENRQSTTLAWLARKGVKRVAVHGGPPEKTIEETLPRLKKLFELDVNIILMIGGGVTKENVQMLKEELNFEEAHGTRIV